MEPLVIITCYNRRERTAQTLAALEETTDLASVDLVVMDDASTDGTADMLWKWSERHGHRCGHIYPLDENIGCPRALNFALEHHRQPGQPVVKLDNDVAILTPGWVQKLQCFEEYWQAMGHRLAMVGANYEGHLSGRSTGQVGEVGRLPVHGMNVVIGHAVWHSGPFMDEVGYFDVLSPDHRYGFEDLIMCHKAKLMGWDILVWEGWEIANLQRWNSLGGGLEAHVQQMRPLYEARRTKYAAGAVRTDKDGIPITRR